MKWQSLLSLAFAETRRSRGRLIFSLISIALGVTAVTAVQTVIKSFEQSIALQARSLMGADLMISANREGAALQLFDKELTTAGFAATRLTEFYSMLYLNRSAVEQSGQKNSSQASSEPPWTEPPSTETPVTETLSTDEEGIARRPSPRAQLVRLRAIGEGFPFYGRARSRPQGLFQELSSAEQPLLIADPGLIEKLQVAVGDRLSLGQQQFTLIGSFIRESGSALSGFGMAPVVYISERYLDDTALVATGSRVRYRYLYRAPPGFDIDAWKEENFTAAAEENLNIQTFRESASQLQRFLSRLSNFLTIIGLITLLLGGLGTGSAMMVFVRYKLDNAAIFRSLGATPGEVFRIYFCLAALLGIGGSLAGAFLGTLLPIALAGPLLSDLSAFLPVEVSIEPAPTAILQGLFCGLVATSVFTLAPIYRLRRVSPLRILRRQDSFVGERPDRREFLIYLFGAVVLFTMVLLLSLGQGASALVGLYFTAALTVAIVLLFLFSRLIIYLARRGTRLFSNYHLRQGFANLYRPGNQTTAVVTAIGMGILLLFSILILEASLQKQIALENNAATPDHFIIDIQPHQRQSVEEILQRAGASEVSIAPMISGRLKAINGQPIKAEHVEPDSVRRSWADQQRVREYFISYRRDQLESEEIVAGRFWGPNSTLQEASLDRQWAETMDINLGDEITFDIAGLPVSATVTSLRLVRWQSMRPNTMVLFSPAEMARSAPHIYIASYRSSDSASKNALTEQLVRLHSNLRIIDLSDIIATVRSIVENISLVMRILAALTLLNGFVILMGTVISSRFARLRESMLLKVLGAKRKDLRRILSAEYALLAILGSLSGWLLAEAINRPLFSQFFRVDAELPYRLLIPMAVVIVLLNVIAGLMVSRQIFRSTPVELLREE